MRLVVLSILGLTGLVREAGDPQSMASDLAEENSTRLGQRNTAHHGGRM